MAALSLEQSFIRSPEEDLLQLYKTHPSEMDGSSRLKQHDNVHKQISAFEKLLQHAMSKFSKDKLYQMLKVALTGVPDLRIPRAMHSLSVLPARLSSISELREVVAAIRASKHHGLQKEERVHVCRYFQTFFDDLLYLKDLKKHFDQKIYTCLYEYFYDPSDEVNISESGSKTDSLEDKDSGNSSLGGSDEDTREVSPKEALTEEQAELDGMYIDFDLLSGREKLSYAVKSLYQVNQKWDTLFMEEELPSGAFDPDSRYEMLGYSDLESVEPILRLVPDIFVKAYKSVELAKLWWTEANKIYDVLPAKKNSTAEFSRKTQELETKIARLKEDIQNEEELLTLKRNDLAKLRQRESKYGDLGENFQQVEERKNDVGQKYNELSLEREAMLEKLKALRRGTNAYRRVQERVAECNHQLMQTRGDLQLLSYHFQLLKEDFNLEMSFRPDIIVFVGDVTHKIESLELSLGLKKEQKMEAEKKLALMRTNCEKMRRVMRKYVSSGDFSSTRRPSDYSGEDNEHFRDNVHTDDADGKESPGLCELEFESSDVEHYTRHRNNIPVRERLQPHSREPAHQGDDDVHPSSSPYTQNYGQYLADAMDNGMILLDDTIQEDDGAEGDTDTPTPTPNRPRQKTPKQYSQQLQLRHDVAERRQQERKQQERVLKQQGRSRIPMSKPTGSRRVPEY